MSQVAVVIRLALRELWISFRLLFLLAAYVAAGTVVALLPAPVTTTLVRLAIGLAAAGIAGAAVAAWSMSRERTLGRAGWLTTHSVPRATIVLGWFVPLALVSALGLLAAGVLGWLAIVTLFERPDGLVFGATVASVATFTLALIAIGLLLGAILGPSPAAAATAVICVLLVAVPWMIVPRVAVPIEALARLVELPAPLSVAVQGAGASLAAAGVLLVGARFALERVDL
ncbi:MAG: hypothetical protein ACR2GO_05245 [Candidatus Limnocylindria bacterium]